MIRKAIDGGEQNIMSLFHTKQPKEPDTSGVKAMGLSATLGMLDQKEQRCKTTGEFIKSVGMGGGLLWTAGVIGSMCVAAATAPLVVPVAALAVVLAAGVASLATIVAGHVMKDTAHERYQAKRHDARFQAFKAGGDKPKV